MAAASTPGDKRKFYAFEPGQFTKTARVLNNASALCFTDADQMAFGSRESGAFSIRATVEAMTEQSAHANQTEHVEALLRENGL